MINYSIDNHTFPKLWNKVIIKPIGKISQPKIVSDTRPIVLNSVITKIISSIFNGQLREFIENNNLLTEYQSGFRNNHSCTTALMSVSEDIRSNIRNNKLTVLVLLDIKSAYPSVSHHMLMNILKNYGVGNNSRKWIASFLSNKSQIVELNNQRSSGTNINCGLLQGDNLSQTFFSLVINGVINVINHCRAHLYADDLAIQNSSEIDNFEDMIENINNDIINIDNYIKNHGMQLNPSKTKAIIIGDKKLIAIVNNNINIPKVKVCDLEIEYSESVKYLGFNLTIILIRNRILIRFLRMLILFYQK